MSLGFESTVETFAHLINEPLPAYHTVQVALLVQSYSSWSDALMLVELYTTLQAIHGLK